MKKLITAVTCIALIAIVAMTLTGCNNTTLNRLSKEFKSIAETTTSMDKVEDQDLNSIESNLMSDSGVYYLSTEVTEQTVMTPTGKVSEALALHDEIKTKTLYIETGKTELKSSITDIKEIIRALREQNIQLTEEERLIIEGYITEIKEINVTLRETIGKAYKRMYDLRGSYKLANIDTIVTTFTEVNQVLDIRVTNLDRLNVIAEEVEILLNAKIIE